MNDIKQLELLFFEVLQDLKDYLDDLTLVGGWLSYVYSKFLWHNLEAQAVTTVDIDFGFGGSKTKPHSKTIFEVLSSLNYKERHLRIGKMYPVVLYKQGEIPIDFITSPKTKDKLVKELVGRQIVINKIDKFDFLLENRIPIRVRTEREKIGYIIQCPKPSAFLYHKGSTFIDREEKLKQAKDLHYMYFILRYTPNLEIVLSEIAEYKKKGYFIDISKNIKRYFERKTSQGCLMIEKENGPDEYIDDLRQDIFERFNKLLEFL
ncbi:MAG TPA: GSU2403 family nucleotidyltransferase fold protein [Atribacterota bacterium]|nr:GSU2403 family nucleotidyltransferase fold protein [Atribacterota bacterium]